MQKKSFAPVTPTAWTEPLSRTLQACNPRLRQRRRVTEVSLVLLSFMQDLQMHRGLSCAVLDGQDGFHAERTEVGEKLQRSLHELADIFGANHPVFRGEQWQQLLARWDSLYNNWRSLDFHTNLTVHSELVLGLVAILRLLADENSVKLGPEWREVITEWPPMVEHLGMLRAIGVHILGSSAPAHDRKVQLSLKVHLHEARSTLASVERALPDLKVAAASHQLIGRVSVLAEGLPPAGAAQRFYAEMTRLIDDWYGLIRAQLRTGTR